jgi:hypothetical protein
VGRESLADVAADLSDQHVEHPVTRLSVAQRDECDARGGVTFAVSPPTRAASGVAIDRGAAVRVKLESKAP